MPINIYWDNEEKTIIRADFDAEWTWDDYRNAIETMLRMNEGITHRIHQLVDMSRAKTVPASSMIVNLLHGRKNDPENLGVTVIIGAPELIKIFVSVIERAYKTHFPERWMVKTLEEAYECIQQFELELSEG